MCGIAGLTDRADFQQLPRMLEIITHRGPDDQGVFVDEQGGVAIGMRRLSIQDVSAGRQPMANEDESIWAVFNGEIYNAPELRKELEAKGHRFRTDHSDTEVLPHLYEQYGAAMLSRLNGMFGFVIYDVRRQCLFGARDRTGIKPMYYANDAGKFAFASELKCLTVLPWVSCDIDFDSFYHYLSLQFVPAPNSILRDVKKLPAGHYFEYELSSGRLNIESYWRLKVSPNHSATRADLVKQLRAKLVAAVCRRTLSDVPIACSLSGGLDSSAIVGILAQNQAAPLRTYSVGFSGPDMEKYNELPLAKIVAQQWGTEHHEIIVEPRQLLDDLEQMVWHLDEPYGGGLPSWYVYREISSDCKVALTGLGGDELFGNYQKWRIHERSTLWKWQRALRHSVRWRQWKLLRDFQQHPQGHLYHRYLTDAVKDACLPSGSRDRLACSTEALLQQAWDQAEPNNPRDAVAQIDFQMQLPEEFLLVADRFSMAHSVEARVPFLDHELVEATFTVPAKMRTRRGAPKYLAKEIVAPFVPSSLLDAPKKGFMLPLEYWTRNELRSMIGDMLGPAALHKQGLFSRLAWDKLVEPHMKALQNRTPQVWSLLMFQLWQKQLLNSGGSTHVADSATRCAHATPNSNRLSVDAA